MAGASPKRRASKRLRPAPLCDDHGKGRQRRRYDLALKEVTSQWSGALNAFANPSLRISPRQLQDGALQGTYVQPIGIFTKPFREPAGSSGALFPGAFAMKLTWTGSETTNGRLIWSGNGLLGQNYFDPWCEMKNISRSQGLPLPSSRGQTFSFLLKKWRSATRSP